MATFPSIKPTYGQRKNSAPLTRTIRFADGYEHRILFGIAAHQNPKNYSLKFENITEAESDTIEYFLNERALDQASFTFTPPGEDYSKTGTYSQSGTTIYLRFKLTPAPSATSDVRSVTISNNGASTAGGNVTVLTNAPKSDIRFKTNIDRIGYSDMNIPIYLFNYKDDEIYLSADKNGIFRLKFLKYKTLSSIMQSETDGALARYYTIRNWKKKFIGKENWQYC